VSGTNVTVPRALLDQLIECATDRMRVLQERHDHCFTNHKIPQRKPRFGPLFVQDLMNEITELTKTIGQAVHYRKAAL
jgi:hypothetical protein